MENIDEETVIEMTNKELMSGINGHRTVDGVLFMIRNVTVKGNKTTVEGLWLGTMGRGIMMAKEIDKRVSSYTEVCKELHKIGF
jgi:hypothetical protein